VTREEPVRATLARHSPVGVTVEADRVDPRVLRVVIPESLLNFESGRSTLTAPAERFVATVVPSYAAMLCGDLRDEVEGVVIEGHTDDLGGDALNLRLSQERSLSVLIRALDAIREAAPEAYDCFSQLASASGRGKQDLVYDDEQHPDRELSRRVVLKILLRGDAPALNRPS
jgi:outer membrane protein OmpA-like peptidoglycan-associated protein